MLKRIFDLVFSILLLIVTSPILLVIALFIKVDTKGPVIYTQKRVGKNGVLFLIYKFRTMVTDAENKGAKHRVLKNDPRITQVGIFLRKYSLDELPQLFNIVKSEMSFVGPRPTLEWQVDQYSEYQRKRLIVKPGITGLAQCRGRKSLNWNQRIRLDVLYVKNQGILLDFWILLQTIKILFKSDDVYREGPSWVDD